MRNYAIAIAVGLFLSSARAKDDEPEQSKTKRGIVEQTYYYDGPEMVKSVQNYQDTTGAATGTLGSPTPFPQPRNLPYAPIGVNIPYKPVIDQDHLKQVTAQQVLYEYQQTPHTTVSNVHFNQQYGSIPGPTITEYRQTIPDAEQSQTNYPIQPVQSHFVNHPQVVQVEPNNHYSHIAAPVQHGAVIHHHAGQGYSKVLYNPLPLSQLNNPQQPQKYLYVNGKIVYHPPGTIVHSQSYPGLVLPARAYNINQYNRPYVTQKPFRPSPIIPSNFNTYNRFPIPTTTTKKPIETPVKEEVNSNEEEEDKSDVKEESNDEEEAEEEEEHSSTYDDEEEEDSGERQYQSHEEDDDDDDEQTYHQDQENDEDTDSTKHHSVQVRRHPNKKHQKRGHKKYNDSYKYHEGYSKKVDYDSPGRKGQSLKQVPKSQYKTYRYYKSASNIAPTIEKLEGHESGFVPIIINKQKIARNEKRILNNNINEKH